MQKRARQLSLSRQLEGATQYNQPQHSSSAEAFDFCKVSFWVTFKRYLTLSAFLRKSKKWLIKVAKFVVSKLNPGNQEQFYRPSFDTWWKKIKQLAIWRNFFEKSSFFIKQGKAKTLNILSM